MDIILLESDREYVKKEVSKHIDRFFDDFKKALNKLGEQEKLIKRLEYSRTIFARGYAIKLGVLRIRKKKVKS